MDQNSKKNDYMVFREKEKKQRKKKRKKENGAHNHLSQLQKLRASKYSRHVVLCKYRLKNKKKTSQPFVNNRQ